LTLLFRHLAEKIKSTAYDKEMANEQKMITKCDLSECNENHLEALVEMLISLITRVIEQDQHYIGE
jgi:hypothetical protein